MTNLLVKTFIKNPDNIDDPAVREKYGRLSSIVGIVCNALLFGIKYFIGTISGSISIVSDAFNNLSDGASCLVTLFGFRLAAKPADKDHPFGHGRMEYLTSMIIAAVIFLMGFELLKSSVGKITAPEPVMFSAAAVISLIASIGVKLWMSAFNGKLGRKISSPVMLATARDSRNDVFATGAALIGLTASLFTELPVDGVMGLIVSVLIIKAGFEILKDTVDELLGKPADKEIVEELESLITSSDRIIGIHDMLVHNYGPGKMIASCHAEVRSDENFSLVHEIVDAAEREVYNKMGIIMTIHMDPVDVDNEQVRKYRTIACEAAKSVDSRLKIHDFRMVTGDISSNLIFDVVVPYDVTTPLADIKTRIDEEIAARESETKLYTVITFDREFC